MRITSGTMAGRKLKPPLSTATRPMMDRIRQALFNILAHHEWGPECGKVLSGTRVLDAFCGTGALAFEALSQGASHATLLDKESEALGVAEENAKALQVLKSCSLINADTLKPPKAPSPCDLVFVCPPYRKALIPPALIALEKAGWLADHVLIVAETALGEPFSVGDTFTPLFHRSYSDTTLYFLTK